MPTESALLHHDHNAALSDDRFHYNRKAYAAAAIALREFRRLYRKALNAWREKARDVLFPPETFVMRWLHAADVAVA